MSNTMRFHSLTPRLPVADLPRALHFYTRVLGFRENLRWPADTPTFALLTRDNVHLGLHTAASRAEQVVHVAVDIYIEVDDARPLHADLQSQGISIEWGPEVYSYGRREFAFRDPDGYLVIITEPTDDPPTCLVE